MICLWLSVSWNRCCKFFVENKLKTSALPDGLFFLQSDDKPASLARFRIHRDRAASLLHDCLADRQTDARTLSERVHLLEPFEDTLLVFLSYADARILHHQFHTVGQRMIVERHRARAGGELVRVEQQGGHHRVQPAAVHLQSFVQLRAHRVADVVQISRQVEVGTFESHTAAFYHRQHQHVVQDMRQHIRVVLDHLHKLPPLLIIDIFGVEQLCEARYRVERGTYLVAHVPDEGRLHLARLLSPLLQFQGTVHLPVPLVVQAAEAHIFRYHAILVVFARAHVHRVPFRLVVVRQTVAVFRVVLRYLMFLKLLHQVLSHGDVFGVDRGPVLVHRYLAHHRVAVGLHIEQTVFAHVVRHETDAVGLGDERHLAPEHRQRIVLLVYLVVHLAHTDIFSHPPIVVVAVGEHLAVVPRVVFLALQTESELRLVEPFAHTLQIVGHQAARLHVRRMYLFPEFAQGEHLLFGQLHSIPAVEHLGLRLIDYIMYFVHFRYFCHFLLKHPYGGVAVVEPHRYQEKVEQAEGEPHEYHRVENHQQIVPRLRPVVQIMQVHRPCRCRKQHDDARYT